MYVKDFAIKTGCVGDGEETVKQVFLRWVKEKQNIFIIVDKKGKRKIKGVITLYDILKELIPFYLKLDTVLVQLIDGEFLKKKEIKKVLSMKVKELMTKEVSVVEESDSLIKAVVIMYNKNFDYLPVINSKGEFLGKIVTRNSVEEALLELVNK